MTTPQEHVVDWLRDAYAMEKQAETMLTAQSKRLENYPLLRERIDRHIEETLSQQQLLETCLDRLGSSPSAMKDLSARMSAFMQGAGGMAVSDEVIKGGMAGYVFEHVEIAAYTTLIAAANAAGDIETRRICEQILPQEVEMAKWLLEHLPETVTQFLGRSAADRDEAKR
ncbi:ferritin-like domain-containing protein [Paraburkholderia sp.]|jgi:ferritin-like metal-binding protein YciE|uniref:ferritin-like domain-containing protein n=1 Tax=Paraburkholderia sp. TaxID=1926495 RepID=UPI002F42ED28